MREVSQSRREFVRSASAAVLLAGVPAGWAGPVYASDDRHANFPMKSHGTWWLTQFRRWGMVKEPPDYKGLVDRVHRPDIFREVARQMGVETPRQDTQKETFFDGGVFDPATDPEKYAKGFAVHTMA